MVKFVSSESVVSITLAHTGTAASEKSTLVQALHNGCIKQVGESKTDPPAKIPLLRSHPYITDISGPLLYCMVQPTHWAGVEFREGPDFRLWRTESGTLQLQRENVQKACQVRTRLLYFHVYNFQLSEQNEKMTHSKSSSLTSRKDNPKPQTGPQLQYHVLVSPRINLVSLTDTTKLRRDSHQKNNNYVFVFGKDKNIALYFLWSTESLRS